jgi:hypothetical protein
MKRSAWTTRPAAFWPPLVDADEAITKFLYFRGAASLCLPPFAPDMRGDQNRSCARSVLPLSGTRSAVGSTIVKRIRISRFGEASGRCSAFEVRRRCRSSAQFTPRSTTNSIRSAISSRCKSTSRDALLPSPSGALSPHRSALARSRSRYMSTSPRYFATPPVRRLSGGSSETSLSISPVDQN